MTDITDWDCCDEHESTFPRHGECPYCTIETLQARINELENPISVCIAPTCAKRKLQARIDELESENARLSYIRKQQGKIIRGEADIATIHLKWQSAMDTIDRLDAALAQAITTANLELEAGLHKEYCPHGAKWGTCEQCPARAGE